MIACDRCRTPVGPEELASFRVFHCSGCGGVLQAEPFPALFRGLPPGVAADPVVEGEEAGCFYHPDRRASVACDECGRFLCRLCDLELGAIHLCPRCLGAQEARGEEGRLVTERTLWDRIALALAVYPMIVVYLTVLTAPAVLFLCFRFWRAPGSLVGRSRWRFVLAGLLAALQLGFWLVLSVTLVVAVRRG